jgi:hypothetical protein
LGRTTVRLVIANHLYHLRIHPRSNHRPTSRAPGQGRQFPDALFPVWRYHPFFTNTDAPVDQADITHRQHAIIDYVDARVMPMFS